jgi:hypothetical protein
VYGFAIAFDTWFVLCCSTVLCRDAAKRVAVIVCDRHACRCVSLVFSASVALHKLVQPPLSPVWEVNVGCLRRKVSRTVCMHHFRSWLWLYVAADVTTNNVVACIISGHGSACMLLQTALDTDVLCSRRLHDFTRALCNVLKSDADGDALGRLQCSTPCFDDLPEVLRLCLTR